VNLTHLSQTNQIKLKKKIHFKILHLIISSNFALLKIAIPLKSSNASINPLLSVSHITKWFSLTLKIFWKCYKSRAKELQIALKLAIVSQSFDNDTYNNGLLFFL
jgi:hypothetical protein